MGKYYYINVCEMGAFDEGSRNFNKEYGKRRYKGHANRADAEEQAIIISQKNPKRPVHIVRVEKTIITH